MMYGRSLTQSIQQQVLHCQPPVSKSRVGLFRRGIGFLKSYAKSIGLPVAKRKRMIFKVTSKLQLFHTVMNRLVNWYAVCGGVK